MVLNYIWVAFFLVAFVIAVVRLVVLGDTEVFPAIINSTFDSAKTAFEISLGLTGVLALWMGVMKVGERGGVVQALARVLSPVFVKLFPEIPKGHPVVGNIFMNIAANMLGLDNAATPMGLKAMEGLQELNPKKDTASNAMIMFLVLNTSGLTIIPVSIMVYRAQLGAAQPTDVFIPILLATFFSTLAGIIVTSLYQRINLLNRTLLLTLGGMSLGVAAIIWGFGRMSREDMALTTTTAANTLLFLVIVGFIVAGVRRRINVYDAFIEGAFGRHGVDYRRGGVAGRFDGLRHRVGRRAAHGVDEAAQRQRCARHDGRCHDDLRCGFLCRSVELHLPRCDGHDLLYFGRLLRQCRYTPHASRRGLRLAG